MNKKTTVKVIELVPRPDQASKPSELIQITGHENLSAIARRSITLLWHNAHRQGVEEGKDYVIPLTDLVSVDHRSYQMVEEDIVALMQTIITVKHADGSVRRVQFLGGNDMSDPNRPSGTLTYSFDKRLVEVLRDSSIWGKISLPVLMSLSSKYAVSLYENVAQWAGLEHKISQVITVKDFRDMLGVEGTKYEAFGAFNKHVIKPVVQEINALASFNISILPIKTGRKVTHIRLGWWVKSLDEEKLAWSELQKSSIGRKVRISNQVSTVFAPTNAVKPT